MECRHRPVNRSGGGWAGGAGTRGAGSAGKGALAAGVSAREGVGGGPGGALGTSTRGFTICTTR